MEAFRREFRRGWIDRMAGSESDWVSEAYRRGWAEAHDALAEAAQGALAA